MFRNNGANSLVIMLDIEEDDPLVDVVLSDDKFTLTEKKMTSLLQETKSTEINREHVYKWQTGFY